MVKWYQKKKRINNGRTLFIKIMVSNDVENFTLAFKIPNSTLFPAYIQSSNLLTFVTTTLPS